jgi:hypothetical protein
MQVLRISHAYAAIAYYAETAYCPSIETRGTDMAKAIKYLGFTIEQEIGGNFSIHRFGYLTSFRSIDECMRYIEWKAGR